MTRAPASGPSRPQKPKPGAAQDVSVGDAAATQTERGFDLVHLDPFGYDTPEGIAAWTAHLAGVEQHLRLFAATPGMLTEGVMPEYLFRRTRGIVGLLERLIEDGCAEAVDSGVERLTTELLDGIDLNLGNVPGRDPSAGEVPTVPPRPRAPKQPGAGGKRPRSRNTVFDDHGHAATMTAATDP